jgi:hypothetical protein
MGPKNQPEPGFLASGHSLERLPWHELTPPVRRESTGPATPAAQPMVACGNDHLAEVGK